MRDDLARYSDVSLKEADDIVEGAIARTLDQMRDTYVQFTSGFDRVLGEFRTAVKQIPFSDSLHTALIFTDQFEQTITTLEERIADSQKSAKSRVGSVFHLFALNVATELYQSSVQGVEKALVDALSGQPGRFESLVELFSEFITGLIERLIGSITGAFTGEDGQAPVQLQQPDTFWAEAIGSILGAVQTVVGVGIGGGGGSSIGRQAGGAVLGGASNAFSSFGSNQRALDIGRGISPGNIGVPAGGGSGNTVLSVGRSAKGNLFKTHSITQIAEKNRPEAVLPLTRFPGGDLGVKMSGGGASGGNMVSINAPFTVTTTGDSEQDLERLQEAQKEFLKQAEAVVYNVLDDEQRSGGRFG